MSSSNTVGVVFTQDKQELKKQVAELAIKEKRSLSSMCLILIEQAMNRETEIKQMFEDDELKKVFIDGISDVLKDKETIKDILAGD